MNWMSYLSISFYSIALLVFLCIHAFKERDKVSFSHKAYLIMVNLALALLVFDIISRLENQTGIVFEIVNLANAALFILGVLTTSVWVLYVDFQIFQSKRRIRRLLYPLAFLNVLNILFLMVSQFTGWVYYFDHRHVYHRGPLFLLPGFAMFGLIVAAMVCVLVNHRRIESKYVKSLLFFPIAPLVGGALQTVFYQVPLSLTGVAVSMLVLFINVQNKGMNIDSLTGIYNRRKLDNYLYEKISSSNSKKTFSVILIDMDNFKDINDHWGHVMGDRALRATASILRSSCTYKAFVARYGGDEFCIILDNVDADCLKKCAERIRDNLAAFNDLNKMPYCLGFSIGYKVYDQKARLSANDFLREVDKLMYQDKKLKEHRITAQMNKVYAIKPNG